MKGKKVYHWCDIGDYRVQKAFYTTDDFANKR